MIANYAQIDRIHCFCVPAVFHSASASRFGCASCVLCIVAAVRVGAETPAADHRHRPSSRRTPRRRSPHQQPRRTETIRDQARSSTRGKRTRSFSTKPTRARKSPSSRRRKGRRGQAGRLPRRRRQPLKDEDGKPVRLVAADLDTAEHDSNLRGAMKGVLDLLALADPDRDKRMQAIDTLGMAQEAEKLPALLDDCRRPRKTAKRLRRSAAKRSRSSNSSRRRPEVQIAACQELGALGSIPSQDFLTAARQRTAPKNPTCSRPRQPPAPPIASHRQDSSIPSAPPSADCRSAPFCSSSRSAWRSPLV